MAETEPKEEKKYPVPEEKIVTTRHSLILNGKGLSYSATTGTLILKEEHEKEDKSEGEKAKAAIFFVAYTREDADPATRPITFAFNGGPGSSSVWLHLGLLGPKRVLADEDGNAPPPPYRLVNNDYSLLDQTDLVFIDPVSTGFSRAVPGEKPKEFHAFQKDIESVGDFIRLYTSRYQRWASPKFLAGESYGTTRSAGLSGYLQERHGMYLNGILLISSILNFQTAYFTPGNDLPYALFLPTYAATAWYHGRLSPDLQADLRHTLAEVEQFALGEYTLALMQGAALPAETRTAVAQKLARYTGLSAEYIERADLRLEIHRFCKELLRAQGRTVGRLDTRFTGVDRDGVGEYPEFDPSYAAIQGPYTATLNDYMRRDLQFESDLPYEILTGRVWPWNYEPHQNRFVDVAETLRKAISINPHLKVFIANGYYDLATPYLATRYTVNHLGLAAELQANVHLTYYEAGHMMYVHRPSLAQLKEDMAAWLATAVT
ncbi:MAG: peptidase S10 [Chloroflexi bacterium]|nr:peptidase S10 [Chloroflexota bacterium]